MIERRETDILVGLAIPEIGRGCGTEDRLGHAEETRHLEDLRFVEISDQLHVHNTVSGLAKVAQISVLVWCGPCVRKRVWRARTRKECDDKPKFPVPITIAGVPFCDKSWAT